MSTKRETGRGRLVVDPSGGGDFTTINEAVSAAAPGARITVRPGVYRESLEIQQKPVHLVGDGAAADVVIESDTAACLMIVDASGTLLRNLTLRHTGKPEEATSALSALCDGEIRAVGCEFVSGTRWVVSAAVDVRLTLERCVVRGGALAAVHLMLRAVCTLDRCTVRDAGSSAVDVSGRGTRVALRRCDVEGFRSYGVYLTRGAAVEAERRSFSGGINAIAAVSTHDKLTTATLTRCTFGPAAACGVTLDAGPQVELDGCEFDRLHNGVIACGRCRVTLRGCRLRGNTDGVSLLTGAVGELTGCTLSDSTRTGVSVSGKGTTATLTDCVVRASGAEGVEFQRGAGGLLERCRIERSGGPNVLVRGKGTAPTFRDCRIHRGKAGALTVGPGAAPVLEGCELHDDSCVLLVDGPTAAPVLRRCRLRGPAATVRRGGKPTLDGCDTGPAPAVE